MLLTIYYMLDGLPGLAVLGLVERALESEIREELSPSNRLRHVRPDLVGLLIVAVDDYVASKHKCLVVANGERLIDDFMPTPYDGTQLS